ncbi:response regulator transcription factor [Nocardioides dubius]|uniref:Response regulator transcription factor n=1 Tax=Nocardioides dubius TaxID=317019 RepID=A0ABN1TQP4_9ACTN
MSTPPRPPRIAVLNDYEIVVAGIARMLADHPEHVEVVELDTRRPATDDVDIVLFDTFARPGEAGEQTLSQLADSSRSKIVVFAWNTDPELVEKALSQGAAGYLSKALSAERLVEALRAVHDGERIVETPSPRSATRPVGDWPGREAGLGARESEVLALIARGLSNQEIALALYLSVNSVKTHIRNAYRKIGAQRRSQAVRWALENGFDTDPDRTRL